MLCGLVFKTLLAWEKMEAVLEGSEGILFLLSASIPIFQWSWDWREAGVDKRQRIRRNNSGD